MEYEGAAPKTLSLTPKLGGCCLAVHFNGFNRFLQTKRPVAGIKPLKRLELALAHPAPD
jgi:hypothetical protein